MPFTTHGAFARCTRIASVAVLLALAGHSLSAQTTDAAILGIARDSGGTPLAEVTVEARNTATGFIARSTTNNAGRFALLQLPLGGPYIVTARRIGYTPSQYPAVTLGLGDRVDVAFSLVPSVVELEALVATSDSLDERASRVGANTRFDADQLAAMPTVNRNFTDLSALAPTVGPQQSVGGGEVDRHQLHYRRRPGQEHAALRGERRRAVHHQSRGGPGVRGQHQRL